MLALRRGAEGRVPTVRSFLLGTTDAHGSVHICGPHTQLVVGLLAPFSFAGPPTRTLVPGLFLGTGVRKVSEVIFM